MYAIVDIQGQQFKVEKQKKVYVHRIKDNEGSKVTFDNVLLIDNDGKIKIGAPSIKGASVSATVVSHMKGDKIKVFKKKRRKGYQKLNGHRQYLTEIMIDEISESGKAKPKAEAKPKTEEKSAEAAPKADSQSAEENNETQA